MNFAVFIISHERADRVETYDTLKRGGYKGQIFVVIDNEDSMLRTYLDRFGDDVLIFDKQVYIDKTDTLETAKLKASAVYARNAVEDFAKLFELDAFGMFDDDITKLRYRWVRDNQLKSFDVKYNLSEALTMYCEFVVSNNITDVALATVMLYCGGIDGMNDRLSKARQCYAIHIRNAKINMDWKSVMNEDFITEQEMGKRGYIFLTLPFILFETPLVNTLSGGVKSIYDSMDELTRAFLATMVLPSCCTPIYSKGKIVNSYSKTKTFPMIISGRYKK